MEEKNKNINLVISKDVDKNFRLAVATHIGMKKGNIKIAIEEAIIDWIEKKEKECKKNSSH